MKCKEAIGLFHAAFLFLGVGTGILLGYIHNQLIIGIVIGIVKLLEKVSNKS